MARTTYLMNQIGFFSVDDHKHFFDLAIINTAQVRKCPDKSLFPCYLSLKCKIVLRLYALLLMSLHEIVT